MAGVETVVAGTERGCTDEGGNLDATVGLIGSDLGLIDLVVVFV
jgi:hypothetical protein